MRHVARLPRSLAGLLLVLLAGAVALSFGCAAKAPEELPEVSAPVPIPPLSDRAKNSLQNLFNATCDPTYLIYREGESDHIIEARSEQEWSEREAALRSCGEQVVATGFSKEKLEQSGFDEGQVRAILTAIEEGYYTDLVDRRIQYEREHAGPIAAN